MKYWITCLSLIITVSLLTGCQKGLRGKISAGRKLPVACAGHAGGIVDGKIFIAGGNNWSADQKTKNWLAETYYFADSSWHKGPRLPRGIADVMYAYDETGLYVCGGLEGITRSDAAYVFQRGDAAPKELSKMPKAADNGCAAMLDGVLYVACGSDADGLSNKMWKLDTRKQPGTWQICAELPGQARQFPAVAACGKYIYVLGGLVLQKQKPAMMVLNDAYRYDPSSDIWLRLKDLPCGGYGWSAARVDNHQMLLAGRAYENSTVSDDVLLLDINNMSMQVIGKLVEPACVAPLIQIGPRTWCYMGGEPAANRSRTDSVSIIELH